MKQNLRRLASFLLALALIVCLAPADAVFVNGQWVIFTIVDDTLLPLNYDTMPIIYSGVPYIPYSIFTDHLGIRAVYNAEENVLILANPVRTLFYDLKNGTCYDDKDYGYDRQATVYNGGIYVPARFTGEFFGMSFSYDSGIPVVRLRSSASTQSDAAIREYYAEEFEKRLEEYQFVPPEEPDPETADPAPAYLMFTGELNDSTAALLDILEQYGLKATFFLSAETILKNEALVRRIYVDGHNIGLTLGAYEPSIPRDLTTAYGAANAALFRVLRTLSRDVCLPGGSGNERYTADWFTALEAAGYRYWDFTVIAPDFLAGADAASVQDSVIESLISVETVQTLVFHSCPAAVEALPGILDYINEREGNILTADTLTATVTM